MAENKWLTGVISPYLWELVHPIYNCMIGAHLVDLLVLPGVFFFRAQHRSHHGTRWLPPLPGTADLVQHALQEHLRSCGFGNLAFQHGLDHVGMDLGKKASFVNIRGLTGWGGS